MPHQELAALLFVHQDEGDAPTRPGWEADVYRARRIARHLDDARLPSAKTLDAFDLDAMPMISKAQIMVLAAGDAWLEKGANLIPSGVAPRNPSLDRIYRGVFDGPGIAHQDAQ
jgi:hypothetical protein